MWASHYYFMFNQINENRIRSKVPQVILLKVSRACTDMVSSINPFETTNAAKYLSNELTI